MVTVDKMSISSLFSLKKTKKLGINNKNAVFSPLYVKTDILLGGMDYCIEVYDCIMQWSIGNPNICNFCTSALCVNNALKAQKHIKTA